MPLTDPEKRRAYEQKRSQDPARKQAKRDRINRSIAQGLIDYLKRFSYANPN